MFSAPVLWKGPRAEIVAWFLNRISICLDARSPTLFQLVFPFKIDAFFLVPLAPSHEVLINSIYDAFIASEIPTTRIILIFGNK